MRRYIDKLNTRYFYLFIAILVIASIFISLKTVNKPDVPSNSTFRLKIYNEKVEDNLNVEIADSPQEREYGLMNRESLDPDFGMLFVFDEEAGRNFWMKDTPVALDIIFFDDDKNFINVARNAQPCLNKGNNCTSYSSKLPAKFVLETKSGRLSDEILNKETKFVIEK